MSVEKLSCPQCGGSDIEPFGYRTYKCKFCGSAFKEVEEKQDSPPPPPVPASKTHYVAPINTSYRQRVIRRSDEVYDDSPEMGEIPWPLILIVIGIIAAVAVGYWAFSSETPPRTAFAGNMDSMRMDSVQKAQMLLPADPDYSVKSETNSNGIEASLVDLVNAADSLPDFMYLDGYSRGSHMLILADHPTGFVRKKKNIFVGKSFSVYDHGGKLLYDSGDLDKSNDASGEDYRKYKNAIGIPLTIDESCGFTKPGNYLVKFRIWDKNGKGELTGQEPVFIKTWD